MEILIIIWSRPHLLQVLTSWLVHLEATSISGTHSIPCPSSVHPRPPVTSRGLEGRAPGARPGMVGSNRRGAWEKTKLVFLCQFSWLKAIITGPFVGVKLTLDGFICIIFIEYKKIIYLVYCLWYFCFRPIHPDLHISEVKLTGRRNWGGGCLYWLSAWLPCVFVRQQGKCEIALIDGGSMQINVCFLFSTKCSNTHTLFFIFSQLWIGLC